MSERNADYREFYKNASEYFRNLSTISGMLAVSLYVYNVIDSIISKGAKLYASEKLYNVCLSYNEFLPLVYVSIKF